MADIFTPEKRSYVMSRIRSKGTKVERQMQSLLEDANISFEAHPDMFGSPDFVAGKHVLIFCDGTFWHGYNYRNGKVPRQKFWREKIERNMRRDRRNSRKLRSMGYSVLRFWEHDVAKRPEFCRRKILRKIQAGNYVLKAQNSAIKCNKNKNLTLGQQSIANICCICNHQPDSSWSWNNAGP